MNTGKLKILDKQMNLCSYNLLCVQIYPRYKHGGHARGNTSLAMKEIKKIMLEASIAVQKLHTNRNNH